MSIHDIVRTQDCEWPDFCYTLQLVACEQWMVQGRGRTLQVMNKIPPSCVWCEDTARNVFKTLSRTFYNPITNQVLHQTCELWQETAPNMYSRDASTRTGDISRKLWTAPTVKTFGTTHSSTSLSVMPPDDTCGSAYLPWERVHIF
jgi:hypothetical protein